LAGSLDVGRLPSLGSLPELAYGRADGASCSREDVTGRYSRFAVAR
jgi:hypothetical protein